MNREEPDNLNMILGMNDYQEQAIQFLNEDRYPPKHHYDGMIARLDNGALGLCGEGGEVADWVKKVQYHGLEFTNEVREKLKKELGDALWYIAECCYALDITMGEVANHNIQKLTERHGGTKFNEQRANIKDQIKLKK